MIPGLRPFCVSQRKFGERFRGSPRDNQHAFHHDDTAEMAWRARKITPILLRVIFSRISQFPRGELVSLFDLGKECV